MHAQVRYDVRGTTGHHRGGVSDGRSTRTGTDVAERPRPGKPEVLVAPPAVLERGLCAAIAAAKSEDPLRPVVVVTPSQVAAAAVPRILAGGLRAAVNVEVFTYTELVRTLADARHGRRAATDLTRTQARILARSVTAHAKGWFEPLAGMPGFADAFCDFLADLRGARVSPEALTRAGLPIEIRRKLSSLATSAREFEDRRGRRRTHEDRVEDATVVIERTMGGVAVMLYGLTPTTDADARLLERILHATAATAFLPALRAPATTAYAPAMEVLRGSGAEAVATPPEPEAADEPTALAHLQRHLFRVPPEPAPDDETVRLVSAAGPADEVREAAAACVASAEAGIAFSDMAVVIPPDVPGYADLVLAELGSAGVPCADLTPRPPAESPAGRAAMASAARFVAERAPGTWADAVDSTLAGVDSDAAGLPLVAAALDELRVDGLCSPPEAEAFREAVGVALAHAPDGAAARHRFEAERAGGGVAVVRADDVGLTRFAAVVFVGLADGLVPRTAPVPALLDDDERGRLNEALSAGLPLAAASTAADPGDFALTVLSARERLTLLRPRSGSDGSYLAASPYFRAAAIALEGSPLSACDVDASPRVAVGVGHARPSEPPGPGVAAWEARRSGDRYSVYEGIVDPGALVRLEQQLPAEGLSPTRLETYAGCPFRFLVENVYAVRRRSADRFGGDPRDRGSLVHEVLERFLRAVSDDGPPDEARRDEQLAILDDTIDTVFASYQERMPPFAAVRDQTRTAIRADLHRWWELETADAGSAAAPRWKPLMFEVPFGRAGDNSEVAHESVRIDTDAGPVELSGRIDRIDISADGTSFRVVDYKTGNPPLPGAAPGLQLPIYVRAAASITGLSVDAGSAEYFHVTRRAGYARTDPEIDAGTGLDRAVSDLCAPIAAGDFHPEPRTCRATGGCEYPEICGRAIAELVRGRTGDPRTTGGTP